MYNVNIIPYVIVIHVSYICMLIHLSCVMFRYLSLPNQRIMEVLNYRARFHLHVHEYVCYI